MGVRTDGSATGSSTTDITAALWSLRGVMEASYAVAPDAWVRQLDFVLAGMRAGPATSTTAMTIEQIDRIGRQPKFVMARASIAPTSPLRCRPSWTMTLAVDDDRVDVGSGRGVDRLARVDAGRSHGVEPDGHQVGARARLKLAGVGPAEGSVSGERVHQLARGEPAAFTAGQPLVHFERAGLVEQVDAPRADRSRARSASRRRASARAGPMPSARSRSVDRAHADRRAAGPSRAMSAALRWVACTAVVRADSAPAWRAAGSG